MVTSKMDGKFLDTAVTRAFAGVGWPMDPYTFARKLMEQLGVEVEEDDSGN